MDRRMVLRLMLNPAKTSSPDATRISNCANRINIVLISHPSWQEVLQRDASQRYIPHVQSGCQIVAIASNIGYLISIQKISPLGLSNRWNEFSQ